MATTVVGLDVMQRQIAALPQGVNAVVADGCRAWQGPIEADMKRNHPWQNRTGLAERELYAQTYQTASQVFLQVGHGEDVYYGVFLETMQQGRFAVLWPTLRRWWPTVRRDIVDRLARRFSGTWQAA